MLAEVLGPAMRGIRQSRWNRLLPSGLRRPVGQARLSDAPRGVRQECSLQRDPSVGARFLRLEESLCSGGTTLLGQSECIAISMLKWRAASRQIAIDAGLRL